MQVDPTRPIVRECPADGLVCSRLCQDLCKVAPELGGTFRVPVLRQPLPPFPQRLIRPSDDELGPPGP